MSRWWRAYDEAVDDPKLQLLPAPLFKAWFNLLCLTSANRGELPKVGAIAFKLRISEGKARHIVAELVARGLFEEQDGVFRPHNWKGRQYQSDYSTERVKRYRQRRSEAGLVQQWQAPKALKEAVFNRDEHRCVYCGATERLSLDHKTPVQRGGDDSFDNLQVACRVCNAAKRDMTHDEFVVRNASVTLQKRPQKAEEQKNRYSEPSGSAADAAPEPVDEDPKAKLFRIGKTALVSFGVTEKRTGSLIGQWLKSRNDPVGLLAAIQYARDQNVADPVAYISALVSAKEYPNGHRKQSLSDLAADLADEARRRERDAGLFGPDDAIRGH